MASFRRMLSCMEYPFSSTVDMTNRVDCIHLVTWLEDRKIRKLEMQEREMLRHDSDNWDLSFSNYLNTLECPFLWPSDLIDCIVWLISYAVSAEYEDCADSCREITAFEERFSSNTTSMVIDNSEDNVEIRSSLTANDVDSIGALLGLSRIENESNSVYLQRISKIVSLTLTPGCMESLKTNNSGGIPLEEFPLGFNTGDGDVNQVATVLKMLYLSDFGDMQNDLNSLIVLGQDYTANPRTNSALGKVGR